MDNFLLTLMNQFICQKNSVKINHARNVVGTTIEIWENKDLHIKMYVFFNNKSGYIYEIRFA